MRSDGRQTAGRAVHRLSRHAPEVGAAMAVWLLGMVLFYRQVLASGFDRLHGDIGDQRLLAYVSEHWLLVAKGHAAWRDPSYFFPEQGVLGYTEAVVLFQPFYVPLRLLGVDQFLAFQLTLMALSTIGFASTYLLLRRVVAVRPGVALIGAFTFAFANNMSVKAGHGQMFAVQFVPLVALLAGEAARAVGEERRSRAAVLGGLGGLLTALLFFTNFYTGFFLALTAATIAVTTTACARPKVSALWAAARSRLATALVALGVAFLGFVAGIVPFLATYLPVLDESGGRTFDEVASFSPRIGDLVNLGAHNLLWGDLLPVLPIDEARQLDGERSTALTPLLVLSAVAGVAVALLWRRLEVDRGRIRVAAGLLVGAAVLTLVTLRFGDATVWRVVWQVVPGAEAIRAVARIQLVLGLVVVVAWSLVADELWRAVRSSAPDRRRWLVPAALAVGVLVAAEQVNTEGFVHLDREVELAALASVPPIPADCSSIVVVDPPAGRPFYATQIDGMLISHLVGRPTMNGYSGMAPEGWSMLDPAAPTYPAAVAAWDELAGVPDGACAFDLTDRSWSGPQLVDPARSGAPVDAG